MSEGCIGAVSVVLDHPVCQLSVNDPLQITKISCFLHDLLNKLTSLLQTVNSDVALLQSPQILPTPGVRLQGNVAVYRLE